MSISRYRLLTLPSIQDARGSLTPLDFEKQLGFIPKRVFTISGVNPGTIRGNHAHKECIQAIQCIQGRVQVLINNGKQVHEEVLGTAGLILVIPALLWTTIKFLNPDSNLIVYASKPFDEEDYLRNYEEFLNFKNRDTKILHL